MPPEYALRVRRSNRYIASLRDILLLLVILRLATRESLGLSQIGFSLNGWQWNLLIGLGATLLETGLRLLLWRLLPIRKRNLGDDGALRQWPVAHWASSNLLSVLAEEVWIAFCVVALKHTGHSTVLSLVLVGAAFGAAHFEYRFFRTLPKALWGSFSASLFLWRGSLLPAYLTHYIGNMISRLYFARGSAPES
jgi:Type II CAAX prenyl endopeptidase Rce1-like